MKTTKMTAVASVLLSSALVIGVGAAPAQAETTNSGTCAGARFDLSVYQEDGGYEVEVEIDHARPRSQWRVTVLHNGRTVRSSTITTTPRGYYESNFMVANLSGSDAFVLKVKPRGTKACSVGVTMP